MHERLIPRGQAEQHAAAVALIDAALGERLTADAGRPAPRIAAGLPVAAGTQIEIAETVVTLFTEHGYDGTTVEQIAEAAGVSLRTFYRYCEAKDDDLTNVLVGGVGNVCARIAAAPPTRMFDDVAEVPGPRTLAARVAGLAG